MTVFSAISSVKWPSSTSKMKVNCFLNEAREKLDKKLIVTLSNNRLYAATQTNVWHHIQLGQFAVEPTLVLWNQR